jgi:hypothetical protein
MVWMIAERTLTGHSCGSAGDGHRAGVSRAAGSVGGMCRNITMLRGLEPAATSEEIEAAARQYVRKVSGVQSVTGRTEAPFERAVALVAEATRELLAELPPRQQPPPTLPPLRRPGVRARLARPGYAAPS